MTKIWYQDIRVLFKNKHQFFPKNEYNINEKANSLVRLALYYSLIIILLGYNQKYLSVSLLLVSLSVLITRRENFTIPVDKPMDINNEFIDKAENDYEYINSEFNKLSNDDGEYKEYKNKKCYAPTENNPFMNFTLDDHYNRPDRPQNCNIKDVYPQMRENFLKGGNLTYPDDLWGTDVSDRNFYTMPNTKIVNDQKKFAEWCFSSIGQCKAFNKDCLERALTRTGTDRYSFSKI